MLSPAYDLISTDLYTPDDYEESALAINGKKNKLEVADFLSLANNLGITVKTHDKIIEKFQDTLPVWEKIIDQSFIEHVKKNVLKRLVRKKFSSYLIEISLSSKRIDAPISRESLFFAFIFNLLMLHCAQTFIFLKVNP